jgi:hypothetical protein
MLIIIMSSLVRDTSKCNLYPEQVKTELQLSLVVSAVLNFFVHLLRIQVTMPKVTKSLVLDTCVIEIINMSQ